MTYFDIANKLFVSNQPFTSLSDHVSDCVRVSLHCKQIQRLKHGCLAAVIRPNEQVHTAQAVHPEFLKSTVTFDFHGAKHTLKFARQTGNSFDDVI